MLPTWDLLYHLCGPIEQKSVFSCGKLYGLKFRMKHVLVALEPNGGSPPMKDGVLGFHSPWAGLRLAFSCYHLEGKTEKIKKKRKFLFSCSEPHCKCQCQSLPHNNIYPEKYIFLQ